MTWSRDGSGLEVKRVRGMTLPYAFVRQARRVDQQRETKRSSVGYLSEIDLGRCAIRMARERRRNRRTKRLAKAAEKRVRLALQRFLDAVRSMGVDLGPKGLEVLTAAALDVGLCARRIEQWRTTSPDGKVSEFRIGALDGPGPVIVSYDSLGGMTSEARTVFDEDRQEADAAIARAIIGEAG